jgi:hypothetical protein
MAFRRIASNIAKLPELLTPDVARHWSLIDAVLFVAIVFSVGSVLLLGGLLSHGGK